MKTAKLLIVSMLALSSAAFAYTGEQDVLPGKKGGGDGGKLSIGVSIGAGIPLMNFAKKDTTGDHNDTTHTKGYANTGFHFNLNAAYKFSDNFGAMLMIGGNMNGFDGGTFTSKHVGALPPGWTAAATGSSYYIGSYLVGPLVAFPVNDKFAVHFRALVGLMTMKFSTLTETVTTPGGTSTDVYSYPGSSGFGYNIGAGVKVGMSDKLSFVGNIDFLGGTPKYTQYTEVYTAGNTTNTRTSTGHNVSMSTGLLNISVGIALNLM